MFLLSVGKIQALLVFCLGFACRQKPNVLECALGFSAWHTMVWGLAKVAIFTTNVYAEY